MDKILTLLTSIFDRIVTVDWRWVGIVILGILVFMVLVILHELGHFIAARKCGLKVTEFGIGLPPKICNLRKDKQGTQYTLNWIPLGGFCSLEGDDPTDKESYTNPNTLFTAKLWKRLIVIFGGVTMNFLTAIVILIGLFLYGIQPISVSQTAEDFGSTSYLTSSPSFLREKGFLTGQVESGVLIQEVQEGGLGEKIDLRQGDILIKFDGIDIKYNEFLSLMASGGNSSHSFTIQRGETEIESEIFECGETCTFGILISENGNLQLNEIKFGFLGAIKATFHEIGAEWNLTMKILGSFGKAIASLNKSEMKTAFNSLSGPVGAVKIGGMIFDMYGFSAFLAFAAMISIALGIFNVLPIPVLDGGRAVGMILQKITKIKPEKFFLWEAYVGSVFWYLLMGLGIILIFKDLIVIWGVNIPFIS